MSSNIWASHGYHVASLWGSILKQAQPSSASGRMAMMSLWQPEHAAMVQPSSLFAHDSKAMHQRAARSFVFLSYSFFPSRNTGMPSCRGLREGSHPSPPHSTMQSCPRQTISRGFHSVMIKLPDRQ